ncbi:MAG: glucuronyl hydrolase, partial [Sphingobacterium sp.]
MKKIEIYVFNIVILLTAVACNNMTTKYAEHLTLKSEFIDSQLHDAVSQYKLLAENLNDSLVPKSYYKDSDSLETSKTSWWTSGFYPGTLLYLYSYSSDKELLTEAQEKLVLLEKEKDNTHTHDLGFMLYCSFGNANRLSENPHYKEIMLTGAESLLTRYNPTVQSIRSWDHNGEKWQFPVIIDNMMNLEFLNWATRESGDNKFGEVAKKHANTTMK